MAFQLNSKRLSLIGMALVTAVLIAGFVARNGALDGASGSKFTAPADTRYVRCINGTQRNDHPRPWLKIVLNHVISVATRLAA